MTSTRLLAVGFIFCCTTVAWSTLGGSILHRTGQSDKQLAQEVAQLWGGRHVQAAPAAFVERPKAVTEEVEDNDTAGRLRKRQVRKTVTERVPVSPSSSRIEVTLGLDQRRKGLLWYDTHTIGFRARYRFRNPEPVPRRMLVQLSFPSPQAIYDGFVFRLDGLEATTSADPGQGAAASKLVPAGAEALVEVDYRSRGLGEWTYAFTTQGVAQVRDFRLDMTTDFQDIDFPPGTLSPTGKTPSGRGWRLSWEFASLVTGQRVGMDPPNRLNPGPLAARITFFAPVSLLFFLMVTVILGILKGQSLHPMHYFFLSAAFFSFHLLLAYLVDHLDLHASFAIAAAVSVFLVVSYLRAVGGWRLALVEAGAAQVVYLLLFSYAFFFEGFTGLTVTVGAVLTLFVLMQLTARIDWSQALAGARASQAP